MSIASSGTRPTDVAFGIDEERHPQRGMSHREEHKHVSERKTKQVAQVANGIHPAWIALIRHCQAIGHGEIERIKIQNGVPVLIEKSVERIKLT